MGHQSGVLLHKHTHRGTFHSSPPKQTWKVTYHLRTALGTAIDIINLLIGWGEMERGGRNREIKDEGENSFQACLVEVILSFISTGDPVCVSQTVAGWLRRAEVFMPVTVTPLLSPPVETWNTIWPQQMGTGPLGARPRCVLGVCVWCQGFLPSIRGPAHSSWDTVVSSQLTTVPTAWAPASGGSVRLTVQLHLRTTYRTTYPVRRNTVLPFRWINMQRLLCFQLLLIQTYV